MFVLRQNGICQTEMPDVLQKGSLQEQLDYIEERTRIYEYYRAIREDMFQQIKKNSLDSLTRYKNETKELINDKSKLNLRIDSAGRLVNDARSKLDEAVRTKNNIKVLGFNINKFTYNSFMWILAAGLAALLMIVFLALKRNLAVLKNTKTDLEELKTEFEAYRKQSRETREKMSMDHFNEVRRLRAQIETGNGEILSSAGFRTQGTEQRPEMPYGASAMDDGKDTETKGDINKPRKRGRRSSGQSEQGINE